MSNKDQFDYLKALEVLRARGKEVQDPYTGPDGIRMVHIDGFPCTDEFVLTEAWGKDAVAEDRQYPPTEQATSSQAIVKALEQVFGAGQVELRSEDAICVFALPADNQGRLAIILSRQQAEFLATHPVSSVALALRDFPPGWPA